MGWRGVDAARAAFRRNSGATGQLTLDDATDEEHAGIAALTGRPLRHGPLRLRLADLDRWLREAFGGSLEAALTAYDGRPPARRADERARIEREAALRRERWRRILAALAEELPEESLGRRWLNEGAHGAEWLVGRFDETPDDNATAKESPNAPKESKESLARLVASALARLPLSEPRRLAAFANDLVGNPHAFDPDAEAGRLLFLALADLFGEELGLDPLAASRMSAAERRALGKRVGLLGETISSSVVVYGLRSATLRDGELDQAVAVPRLQVLPLRRLVSWRAARGFGDRVFVVENPVVFEDLIDRLEGGTDAPTLICTAGWPSLAASRLLDLLVAGGTRQICYSGDFDLAGLRIAAALCQRHPDQLVFWRWSPDDYHAATRVDTTPASPSDLRALDVLSDAFPDLVPLIQASGRWAYQEGLIPLLLKDLVEPSQNYDKR